MKSKLMLAATLTLFALTAVLLARNEQLIFSNEGRLAVEREGDAVVFTWRSDVDVPMARRFAETFDEWKKESDHIIIDLHSPGGAIAEGEAVIRVIDRMKRTHIVDTRVRAGRSCFSMCVPIYLQGEERIAWPSSRFMFHEPTAYDFFTGEKVEEPEFERRMASRRFVERYFVDSEMDPEWRAGLEAKWKGRDVFVTARELVDEHSNIVTVLE